MTPQSFRVLKKIWIRIIHARGGFVARSDLPEQAVKAKLAILDLIRDGVVSEESNGFRLNVDGPDYMAVVSVMES